MSQSDLDEILVEVHAITDKLSDFEPRGIEELSLFRTALEAASMLIIRIETLRESLNY